MRQAALLLVLLLLGCSRPLPAGVTEIVYATPYSPSHPFSRADQAWMAFVERRSGGTLRVRPSWSGALLSSDHSMVELRHGVADVGLITPIYVKGGAHLIRVQSGFYAGIEAIDQQTALYRCMAASHPQFGEELDGLVVLALQGGSLPGIITRERPVRTLADLRGLRIRAPTELLSVLRHLGADPVNMPMGEVYSALAKGVLDGVIAPPDTFRALHFAEVAHHYSALEVPRGAYPARAMGAERWARLSAEHRALLAQSTAVWEAAMAREIRAAATAGIEEAVAKRVSFHRIAPSDQQAFDALYLRDAAANAAGLSRFGIDGNAAFRIARASIGPGGRINCRSSVAPVPDGPTLH